MKIAIHNRPGSFSDRWIEYCNEKNIAYKLVNCYDNDIISQLNDCDALMWHHHHANAKDVLFAKQLIFSIENSGKQVFPDSNTCWHFDDKIGQKYLLESIGAPLIPSYIFYSKDDAFEWIKKTSFPKVFKLRIGAGASNVKLVKNKKYARKLVKQAFSKGFTHFNRVGYFKEQIKKIQTGKLSFFLGLTKGFGRLILSTKFAKLTGKEAGYVYFQDFIPNKNFDVRLIVIGDKAYGMKRLVRKGDFRASGSEEFVYDKIDQNTLKIAFEVAEKLKLQAIAFDFIYDKNNSPLIIEMSYAFGTKGSGKCPGYWNKQLDYFEKSFNPFGWMVENLLE